MSRIEEAWRRANEGSLPETPPAARRTATLEDYVVEGGVGRVRAAVSGTSALAEGESSFARVTRTFARRVLGVTSAPADGIEYYRRLAALVHEAQVERGIKTLVTTSAVPREGKTTTICNLAVALSESYQRRVLLVDADLRRPSVHEVFGIPNTEGLGDALRSDVRAARLVSMTRRLSILPAGRPTPDPVGGLASALMASVVKEAAAEFDWVLLDTPPVGLLPDAQHVTRTADAVLMVIAAGKTPYDLVQRAVGELGADRILGVVLNRVSPHAVPMTAYYRQYYDGTESGDS